MRQRDEALAVLVRAPVGLAYAVLSDVDGWSDWWPGCRTVRADPTGASGADAGPDLPSDADHHRLVLAAGRRRLRCRAAVHGWRHDAGLRVRLRTGADAEAEWWLEPVGGATAVHLLVTARGRRAARVVRALGDGLQALKDHLELAVDVATGRVP